MAPSTSIPAQVFHLIFNCHGRGSQSSAENRTASHKYPLKQKIESTKKQSFISEKQNVGIYSAVSSEQQAGTETLQPFPGKDSSARTAIQSTVWSRCSSHSIIQSRSRPSLFASKSGDQQVFVDPNDEMAALEAEKEDAQTAWAQKKSNTFAKEKTPRPSTRRRISSMFDSKLKKPGGSA